MIQVMIYIGVFVFGCVVGGLLMSFICASTEDAIFYDKEDNVIYENKELRKEIKRLEKSVNYKLMSNH